MTMRASGLKVGRSRVEHGQSPRKECNLERKLTEVCLAITGELSRIQSEGRSSIWYGSDVLTVRVAVSASGAEEG